MRTLGIVLLPLLFLIPTKTPAAVTPIRERTVLVYMNGHNSLDRYSSE